jgi:hypothetical protein
MLPVDIASKLYINMLKEIILCDYNHVDYNPKTDDDLLSSVATVKRRKKVILTTKRLSWPNGPFKPISSDPAERFYRLMKIEIILMILTMTRKSERKEEN